LNRILRWLALFVLVFVVSVAGSFPVFALGLIVHEAISNTLTMLVTGLLAAIGSSWLSNLFRIGGRRSRLLPIVVTTDIVAAFLAVAYFGLSISPAAPVLRTLFPRNVYLLIALGVLLSVSACLAARYFRSSTLNLKRDAVVSFVLLGLAIVVIVATIAVASLFGLTGA
jgi:hypothetical protein